MLSRVCRINGDCLPQRRNIRGQSHWILWNGLSNRRNSTDLRGGDSQRSPWDSSLMIAGAPARAEGTVTRF